MSFNGSGSGLTAVSQGDNGTTTSTTSNRQLSSSFVTHLSRTRTVPSGHLGHIIVSAHFAQAYEESAGAWETRCVVSGTQSVTGSTIQNHMGHHSNNAGSCQPTWSFSLGAGSYTFSLQVREWNGYVELNRHNGNDVLMVQGFYVRD